jgi:hypothetical protein
MGLARFPIPVFLLYCYFNSFYISRNLFLLCAIQNNSALCSYYANIFVSATPRFATQCEIQVKNFLRGVTSICEYLCDFATKCKTEAELIDEKKPRVKNLVRLPF